MSDDRKPFAHGGQANDSGAPAAVPQDVHPEPSHSVPTPPSGDAQRPQEPAEEPERRPERDTGGEVPADLVRDSDR